MLLHFYAARDIIEQLKARIVITSLVSFNLPTELMHEAESAASASQRGLEEVMVRSMQAGLHSLKMT